jgi:hypothetical protein
MKTVKVLAAVAAVALVWAACGYAAAESVKDEPTDPVTGTVMTAGDTTQTAAEGTADIVKTAATDTGETPMTAIDAVKNTAGAALEGADKTFKTITGEK